MIVLDVLGGAFLIFLAVAPLWWCWARQTGECALRDAAVAVRLLDWSGRLGLEPVVPSEGTERNETPEAARRLLETLEGRGFGALAELRAAHAGGVPVRALSHPTTGVVAAVAVPPGEPPRLELYAVDRRDGLVTCLASTQALGPALLSPLGWPAERGSLDRVGTLIDSITTAGLRRPWRQVSAAELLEVFEESHSRDLEATLLRGGPSLEEVSRRARLLDPRVDEEDVQRIHDACHAVAVDRLQELCVRTFLEASGWKAGDWEPVRGRILVVHDAMRTDRLGAYETRYFRPTEALQELLAHERPAGATPRDAFRRLNRALPEGARYEPVGEVRDPVAAELYLAPAE